MKRIFYIFIFIFLIQDIFAVDSLISQTHTYKIYDDEVIQELEYTMKLVGPHSCNMYLTGLAKTQSFFNNLDNSNVEVYINDEKATYLPYEIFINDAKKLDKSFSIVDKCDKEIVGYDSNEKPILRNQSKYCNDNSITNKSIITKNDGFFDICNYKIVFSQIPKESYIKKIGFLKYEFTLPGTPIRESESNTFSIELNTDGEIFYFDNKIDSNYNNYNIVKWNINNDKFNIFSPKITYGITTIDFIYSIIVENKFLQIINAILTLCGIYTVFSIIKKIRKDQLIKKNFEKLKNLFFK